MMAVAAPLSVAIAVGDRVLRQGSERALESFPFSAITTHRVPERGADLVASARGGVLVADLQALGENFGDTIRLLRAQPTPPEVIVLHTAPDAGAVLKAMRAGAREFIFEDVEASLRETISAIGSANSHPAVADGKLYAFLAAKGGSGATILATYIAAALARDPDRRVLLADLHWGCPSIAFLLRENRQYSMQNALLKMDRMDGALWDAMATPTRHGFALAPAPAEEGSADSVDPRTLSSLLKFAKGRYGSVVADCGSGVNPLTLTLAQAADEIVLVTTTDVTALHHAKRRIRVMRDFAGADRVHVVLNRLGKRPDLGIDELEGMLGHPIFGTIPNDYRSLAQACEQGVLLAPEHALSQAISQIAAKLAGEAPDHKKKRFNLFGK